MNRRSVIAGGSAAGIAAIAGAGHAAAFPDSCVPAAKGRRGYPFAAHLSIDRFDYLEEEFILSGTAARFAPIGALGLDGYWTVWVEGGAPYRTRILVRRPKDPARFNGAVIVEWLNVTAGCEVSLVDDGLLDQGFAWVGVSAQRVGVEGNMVDPQGLRAWDPERYGMLSIPGDSLSYDIFTQAARAVGPHRAHSGVDPMGGLPVKWLIATGGSQSGSRLTTYYNAIQNVARVFDGIVPTITNGFAPGFDDRSMDMSATPLEEILKMVSFRVPFREDLDTPLILVNSESEAPNYHPIARPDSRWFRYWEVAGAPHLPGPLNRTKEALFARDGITGNPLAGSDSPSEVSWTPTATAAYAAILRWIRTSEPAPTMPRMEVLLGSDPAIVRDEFGNARGGIRLPELEVPVASYTGAMPPGPGSISGTMNRFSDDRVKSLYPRQDDYVSKVGIAAARAERQGAILAARKQEYMAVARAFRPVSGW